MFKIQVGTFENSVSSLALLIFTAESELKHHLQAGSSELLASMRQKH